MREHLIELLRRRGKKIQEVSITIDHVLKADEVFLTNVIEGIRWVGAFGQKRYFNSTSRWLFSELIEELVKKV